MKKRGHYEKVKPIHFSRTLYLLIGLILLILLLLLFLRVYAPKQTATIKEPDMALNSNSISIPGYEMLELKADSKKQTLCLSNPEQNTCYFQITLLLEDGTLLWQSKEIGPGEVSSPIVLNQKLEVGMYPNALLLYECFAMTREQSPLNGAELKVTLWVK